MRQDMLGPPCPGRPRGRFAGDLPCWALPTAIGVLALVLRLYGLGDKPFWLDELSSLRRATATIPDLVADSLHGSHYPSYFLILWLIGRIGTSEWLLRLPSAVFGAVGASLTCAIGRRVAGSRAGVIAGLLTACSPFEVELGQEAPTRSPDRSHCGPSRRTMRPAARAPHVPAIPRDKPIITWSGSRPGQCSRSAR